MNTDKAAREIQKSDADIYQSTRRPVKWRSIFGIITVVLSIALDMPILFGVLYILWAIQEMIHGQAYILEDVNKYENRALFWIIVFLWLGCGIYVFTDSLIHNWIEPMQDYNRAKNTYDMPAEEYSRYTEIENGYLFTDEDGNVTYYPFEQ